MDLTCISTMIEEGRNEEALASLENICQEDDKNPGLFKIKGYLYSQMGMVDNYLDNLEEAAGIYPDDEEIITELCEILFDLGRKKDAGKYLNKYLERKPESEWAKDMLSEIPGEEGLPSSCGQDFLEHYLSLFIGREDVYAKQVENINGRAGYVPVYGKFGENVLRSHLEGDITAGLYLVRRDNNVTFMVMDIDIKKSFLSGLEESGKEKNLQEKLREDVKKVLYFCNEQSLPYLLEFSGYKGYHLWFFFESPVEASLARKFGKTIFSLSDRPELEVHRELFPKQDSVSEDGLGNLVKLPLGIHRRTGKRCLLIDPETFEPYVDQVAALFSLNRVRSEDMESVINMKREIPFQGENTGENIRILIEKCNILKYLVQKAGSEYYLSRREKMVLSYILGYLEEDGCRYYHRLLSVCKDYEEADAQAFLNSLKPNPMGCSRIRYWIPWVLEKVECKCDFNLCKGKYATPLLHLGFIPKLLKKDDMVSLLKSYVKTLSELEKKKMKVLNIKSKINELLDEQKVDFINTAIGTLTRFKENDKVRFSITLRAFNEDLAS